MERLQSENQHLRGENVTLRNVLQHLGYYVPVTVPNPPSGQPFQQVTQQAAQPNNSTQQPPQQPAQQTVQSNHATQKGGGGQGQAQGYANYPLTTSNYYPQNTLQQQQQALPTTQQQSTPQRPLAQQQLPQQQMQQMQHIQGQQNQRPLMNTQQVSPQIIQSRPQSQASNIACPPNNGGDFTYPVQPQPAPSFYYNPTSSLPHVSSASMPGTVAGTVADSSSGAILQDNSFSSDMTGLGSGYVQHQGQDQNQGGVGGQTGNHGHTDAFIKPEPSYEGLATEGTYLTDGWTMNGWPLQNTATQQQQQQQTGGYADSQQAATQGTKTQQRANNNQNNQNTYQTYQMNSGRPSYDAQKLQTLDQQRNLAGQGSSSQSAQGSSSQNADVQQLLKQLQPLQVFNQQHDSINRNQPVPNQQQSYVSRQSQAFNTQQPQSYQNQYQLQTHVNSTGNTHDGNNGQSQNQVDLTQTTDEDGSDGEDRDDDDDGDYSDDDDEEEDASDGNGVSFTGTDEDHDDGYDSDDDNAGVNTASAANDDNNAIDDPFNNYADDPIMNGWVPELSNFDMDQFLDFAQHADVS